MTTVVHLGPVVPKSQSLTNNYFREKAVVDKNCTTCSPSGNGLIGVRTIGSYTDNSFGL